MNVDQLVEKLEGGQLLREVEVEWLCKELQERLVDQSNIARVPAPITVVGSVHGHFRDLMELFHVAGHIPDVNFLFLGNYVDRGDQGVETLSLLCCYKLRHPNRITLLRGGHESKSITKMYGFFDECMSKYGNPKVWKYFTDFFRFLPVAAIVADSIFCVHGGLSPRLRTLDDIQILDRFMEPIREEDALTDLLWSFPSEEVSTFAPSTLGLGQMFGAQACADFLRTNELAHIVCSNQLCMDGYKYFFEGSLTELWSAPNFGPKAGNVGAVLEIDDIVTTRVNIFDQSPESVFDIHKSVPDPSLLGIPRRPLKMYSDSDVPEYLL